MIIQSLVSDKKYLWVKVPKTATQSYSRLFFPDAGPHRRHPHLPYSDLTAAHQGLYDGFTVVRNPLTRFISALKYIAERNINGPKEIQTQIPFHSIDALCTFYRTHFSKNFQPIHGWVDIFPDTEDVSFIMSFCYTQTHWAYHPRVATFKYENLPHFNEWIHATLGYDTTHLQHIGVIQQDFTAHLNFTDPEFIRLVEYLFHDDYHVFNYPFQGAQ